MSFKGSLNNRTPFIAELSIGCYENNVWVDIYILTIKPLNNLMWNLPCIPFLVDTAVD